MGQFAVWLPDKLSRLCFGAWIIGMGVAHGFDMRGAAFGVLLGSVLVAAGIFSLFGK